MFWVCGPMFCTKKKCGVSLWRLATPSRTGKQHWQGSLELQEDFRPSLLNSILQTLLYAARNRHYIGTKCGYWDGFNAAQVVHTTVVIDILKSASSSTLDGTTIHGYSKLKMNMLLSFQCATDSRYGQSLAVVLGCIHNIHEMRNASKRKTKKSLTGNYNADESHHQV
jgi:hypothetical protein